MENMDKGLTVSKWVLMNRPKVPEMPQIYLPKPKSLGFRWKKASSGVRSPCPVGQAGTSVEEKCQKLPSSNEMILNSDNQIIIEGRASAVNLLPPFLAI